MEQDPEDIPDFTVAPWQIGCSAGHSIKGKSKLVNTLDIVDQFLQKAYNSKNEPLQVLFAPGARVGEGVDDWSLVLSIGMGKASAARMILEAVCQMNLEGEALQEIAPQVKALLRMRCTYDPAPTEEEQINRSLSGKIVVTERPRPDPLMVASAWEQVVKKQGLHFPSVIDEKIKTFNGGKKEGYGLMEHEIAFVKAYPHQNSDFGLVLDQHWQNFKVNESAITAKRLALSDLSPDTKIKRCEKVCVLFNKIFTWTPESNLLWLKREIGVFLRAIKDAQRVGKKVNLRTNAKSFRLKDNLLSHDEICVFLWFMPEFQKHTTAEQFEDLMNRLCKGFLDRELHEKAKVMDEHVTVHDFRFLSMLTGQQAKASGAGSATLEDRADGVELELFKVKLQEESQRWLAYRRAIQAWEAETRQQKRDDCKRTETMVAEAIETFFDPEIRSPNIRSYFLYRNVFAFILSKHCYPRAGMGRPVYDNFDFWFDLSLAVFPNKVLNATGKSWICLLCCGRGPAFSPGSFFVIVRTAGFREILQHVGPRCQAHGGRCNPVHL